MELELGGHTNLVFSVAVAEGPEVVSERLTLELDGAPIAARELADWHGTRLHLAESGAGTLVAEYEAEVDGRTGPAPLIEQDLITYLRPSRYCESDTLAPTARSEFAGLSGHDLLAAVTIWVWERLRYVPGSSLPRTAPSRRCWPAVASAATSRTS